MSVFLYAFFTLHNGACVKKYTVSFSSAYGSMSSQEFIGGVSQNLKQNEFVRPGYSFRGWTSRSSSKDSETASVNYTDKQYITVNSNMTLYALWEKEAPAAQTYTIKFHIGYGVSSSDFVGFMGEQTCNVGEDCVLLPLGWASNKYTFKGWTMFPSSSVAQYGDGATVRDLAGNGSTITLYALWGPKSTTKNYWKYVGMCVDGDQMRCPQGTDGIYDNPYNECYANMLGTYCCYGGNGSDKMYQCVNG